MGQNVIRSRSQISYDYATIKITQSRIDKGLIAIPVPLAEWFPSHNTDIEVYLNDSPVSKTKHYSSYNSSARECRILGVTEWFRQNNIQSGDEIVIQFVDKNNYIYRLIPERNFISKTRELELSFDISESEQEASGKITTLGQWTNLNQDKVVLNEYYRLVKNPLRLGRQYIKRSPSRAKESAPVNIKILLEAIYKGHCQVCDFWFLKKDKKTYFEIHHLDAAKGHHPQNLLVVCGNCHNQFEYADVEQEFNDSGWLTAVSFSRTSRLVRQAILDVKPEGFFKELFT